MMKSRVAVLAGLASFILLAACNTQVATRQDILDVDYTQNVDPTGNFNVPGAWDLKYTFDCSRQQSQGVRDANSFDLIVYNSDDQSTAFEYPEVHALNVKKQNQELHYRRGGTYYVEVDTKCAWAISVIDTSGG